jgi:serine/threonine protein kinase
MFAYTHTGYKPFQGVSYEGIAAAVIQHSMADLPPHLSPGFKAFIAAALTYDPQHRPSAQQLLDHPWVQVCVTAVELSFVQLAVHASQF